MESPKLQDWLTLVANLGVIIGIVLLVLEIRQNTDLMRAQIAMDRASVSIQTASDFANGGEVARIEASLFDEISGFPFAINWADKLTSEERRRYQYKIIARQYELGNDWFQCEKGFVNAEICQRQVRTRMRRNLHRFFELGINFARSQQTYIQTMQDLAVELELPPVNDDGTWQRLE